MRLKLNLILMAALFAAAAVAGSVSAQTPEQLATNAETAAREGRLEDALRDANAAIAAMPTLATAYRARGMTYVAMLQKEQRPRVIGPETRHPATENAANALADLSKAVEFDPRDAYSIAYRGNVAFLLNDLEGAMAEYKRASDMLPAEMWFTSIYDSARKRLAGQYLLAGSMRVDSARRQNDAAAKQRLIDEALAAYTKAIGLDPDNPEAYSSRASLYELTGDHEKEVADLTEAIKRQPDVHLNHYRKGAALNSLKRYAEAAAAHQSGLAVLEKRKGDIELPQNDFRTEIAKNLALAGKFDEAFAMFNIALAVARPSYITFYERGVAYLARGDAANAEADFRKALELGRGYRKAADALRKMGKTP